MSNDFVSDYADLSPNDKHVWEFFHEVPAVAPLSAAMALFFVAGVASFAVCWWTKTWWMLYVPASAWWESAGYAWRLATVRQPRFG